MKFPFSVLLAILCLASTTCAQEARDKKIAELNKVAASDDYPRIDAIVVQQHNKPLVESYFNGFERDTLHDMRSSFKSVTSLLAGIAIDKGLFAVNDEVQQYLPEWKNDPRGRITIKDLLQMKSGLACECFFEIGPCCESDMWETDDWQQFIFDIPLRHDPGLNWAYTSMEPELIGIIISRTSGQSLMDFAKKNLFDPLHMTDYRWYITPNGGGYAAGSFYMKPADMCKIAQLVLNKGSWNGKQLVSAAWIAESTTCNTDVEMSFVRFAGTRNAKYTTANYGYFWYREKLQYQGIDTEVLFASGNGGQYMMVLEDYDAAIAFTGSNYGNWRGKLPFDLLLKYVIPLLEETN